MTSSKEVLPKIREDIRLIENSSNEDGSKSWMIYDPIQNKYFIIGIDAFSLLSKWESKCEINEFLNKLKIDNYDIDEEGLKKFINFLVQNKLVKIEKTEDVKKLNQEYLQRKQNIFKWLVKNYLFIRIPLLKPDSWLTSSMSFVKFFYSKLWQNIVFTLGFIGIVLLLRDWNSFINTFMYLFDNQAMFYYFLSLVFVKSMHELGHAYTAKYFGCKVPTMGVAFLVLLPVLYTDTTDTWKLKSKSKRLKIVLAGMKVEIYLALISTFLWSFLPDGTLKTIAFLIATTSWFTSLMINISPFLRFDGYYALSDWTNTKNLQPRSFALTRWYLRKTIIGINEEVPEYLPASKQRFFIIYAISTWIYRFFLFLGIAVLVYYMVFKVLGIILFIVEIVWFILLPIFKELKVWWKSMKSVKLNKNNIISILVFLLFIVFLVTPWNSKISMPAVLEVEKIQSVYSPYKGEIEEISVQNTESVKKGDLLIKINSPDNNFKLEILNKKIEILKENLDKLAASKKIQMGSLTLQKELILLENERKGLLKVQDKLILTAPFDGIVYKNDKFNEGQWVSKKEAIVTIYNPETKRVIAFCNENDLKNISNGMKGKFMLNSGDFEPLKVRIKDISNLSLSHIEYPELTSKFSGDIAIRENTKGQLITEEAYYRVEMELLDFDYNYKIRKEGVVIVEGEPKSIIERVFTKVAAILIRESGF